MITSEGGLVVKKIKEQIYLVNYDSFEFFWNVEIEYSYHLESKQIKKESVSKSKFVRNNLFLMMIVSLLTLTFCQATYSFILKFLIIGGLIWFLFLIVIGINYVRIIEKKVEKQAKKRGFEVISSY